MLMIKMVLDVDPIPGIDTEQQIRDLYLTGLANGQLLSLQSEVCYAGPAPTKREI